MTGSSERRLQRALESGTVPARGDEPVFHAPWQARLVGIAVAVSEDESTVDWADFQTRLVEAIATDEISVEEPLENPEKVDADYYERWLSALERLVIEEGWVERDELVGRAEEFASGGRSAAEFVEGEHERGPDEQSVHRHP